VTTPVRLQVEPDPNGFVCRAYREGKADWCVASWGSTRQEAIGRCKDNFEPGTAFDLPRPSQSPPRRNKEAQP
jgi:hypothetical protein